MNVRPLDERVSQQRGEQRGGLEKTCLVCGTVWNL